MAFKPQVRTKNITSKDLRAKNKGIGEFSKRSIIRLGSTTSTKEAFPKSYGKRPIIEINTVDSIENSRSKLRMKECFFKADVPQALWYTYKANKFYLNGGKEEVSISKLPYPILAKRVFGFKGKGMVKLDSQKELEKWVSSNNLSGYYFEHFRNLAREYRLHCTADGCFMTWRKLRRSDAKERWFFNSENCNWVSEKHELFSRPNNWKAIEKSCIDALKATGLDIGSFDVRVQSNSKSNPSYILVEVNSAPALGEQGIEVYRDVISKIIQKKIKNED